MKDRTTVMQRTKFLELITLLEGFHNHNIKLGFSDKHTESDRLLTVSGCILKVKYTNCDCMFLYNAATGFFRGNICTKHKVI